jgi:LAS superfamily LD-carboxypeptidase LdcB
VVFRPYKISKRSKPLKEERFLFPYGKNKPKSSITGTGETKMAKKRTVNKSQIVRDALKKNPTMGPSELAKLAELKKLGINAQYISVVKSNAKSKKAGKKSVVKKSGAKKSVTKKKPGRKPGRKAAAASPTTSLDAAIDFIQSSGGLDQAQAAIDQIRRIQSL